MYSTSEQLKAQRERNDTHNLMGFINGYVAGNIQYGSTLIASHISSLIDALDNLKTTYAHSDQKIESEKLSNAIRSLKNVSTQIPSQVLPLITSSLSDFRNVLEEDNFIANSDRKSIGKKIIYHFLSIANQIKDSAFTNLITEVAEKNKKKVLENAQ